MAAINQKIKLQFETDLQQAKQDVTKLGELYEQSTSPTAQQGPLSADQKTSLESEIGKRAQDLGVSPDKVKKNLEDINKLKEQARMIDQQNAELTDKITKSKEKQAQAQGDENAAIQRAGKLLGLKGQFGKAEVETARESLRTSKDLNISEQKRKEILTGVTKEFAVARGAITRQNNALIDQQKYIDQINQNTNKQGPLVDKIRKIYLKLTRTTDERDTVEGKVTQEIVKQRVELGKNAQASKDIEAATKKNEKAHAEYTKTIKQTPDSFGGKVTSAFLYFQALSAIRRVARDAVKTITELDKALTDIAVVTSMTRKETWNLLGTYQTMAKEVGLTTTEVANLSIAFFRQGRSAVDALRLTETAAKFARIAAIDVNEAANFLTAAINGFNLSASDATSIIDKFAALGASAAASASEIAIALSKVAPAAASAGVEIDTLMAFVTKGIETTREAPENIGTAFKTIFARMRQLTDIGTTIEDGMSVNRVEDSLKSIGVELRDANGEFRNLDDVLIEVGKKWDTITRNQQAYIGTTLAGTRQQTRLIALFEDFDRTLELIEVSQNSAGIAAIQHEEFMTGLEATTTRLKTSFQELITSFVNSDVIIGALQLLNGIVELSNTGMGRLIVTVVLLSGAYSLIMKKIGGLTKLKSILFTKTMAQVAAEKSAAWAQRTAGVGMVANVKATKALAAAKGKATIATMIMNAALALNPLVWIAAAIVAIIGLALAFKKVRESSDTTNIKIARLKIVFDRWAASFKKIFDTIAGGFKKLIDAAIAFYNHPVIKILTRAGLFVATLGLSETFFFLNTLSEVEEAAAGFRVLTNTIKTNNKQIQILESNMNQLNKSLDSFERLNNIAFKTPAELKEFNESVSVLKDNIKSTLDNLLEEGAITEAQFGQKMAILQFSNDPAAIQAIGQELSAQFETQIKGLKKENKDAINAFMDEYDVTWAEAIKHSSFADQLQYLPAFAQELAADALTAFQALNDLEFNTDQTDAVMRAIALDPSGYLDGIKTSREATEDFFFNVIPAAEGALDALVNSSKPEEFAANMAKLNQIDLSDLTPDQVDLFNKIFPNFENLKDYTEEQYTAIAKAGGIAYIREFQDVRNDIGKLRLPNITLEDDSIVTTGEQQEEALNDYLFDRLAVGAEDRAAVIQDLLTEVFTGVVNGVTLDANQQKALSASLVDLLGTVNVTAIRQEVDKFRSDMDSIEEIITKPIDKMTTKDLELLQQYPDIFSDLMNGQLNLNEHREKGVQTLEKDIALQQENLLAAGNLQKLLFDRGLITKEQYEATLRNLETEYNVLDLSKQQLRVNKVDLEAIKERYKIELASLNASKQAMADAKAMRELQQESADIASKTLAATRIGAVGTMEAQFNRQQLNTEIAAANKVLQDNIMQAQLEAQQKILEDSQQKAIEAATEQNTVATRENTGGIKTFTQKADAFAQTVQTAADTIAGVLTGTNRPVATGISAVVDPFDVESRYNEIAQG